MKKLLLIIAIIVLVLVGFYIVLNFIGVWEGVWDSIKEAFRMASGS